MSKPLNDPLADLFDNAGPTVRTTPVRADTPEYMDAEARFIEGCPKCRGTGRTPWGVCFKCKGKGKRAFAQSADRRARNRVVAATRRERTAEQNVADFEVNFPAEAAWLTKTAERWHVAGEFLAKIAKYGELTENQMAVVTRGMARDESRVIQRAANLAAAPVADSAGVNRLHLAFDTAKAKAAEKGRKLLPRLTVGGVTISPAGANSANAGGLYVKTTDRQYLGKVIGGRFIRSQECNAEQEQTVLKFIADPRQAAQAYGKEFKFCCICNRKLTLEESMTRGMGAICAENFGWS